MSYIIRPRTTTFNDDGTIEREDGLLRCDCGADVYFDGSMTTTCDCGADYNWNGARLAPRSQWGEETGECY